jgi:multidrug efflux pump subunit AcrA (membrane-fusion protein)
MISHLPGLWFAPAANASERVFFGALFGWKAYQSAQGQAAMAAMRFPPATVSTVTATTEVWTPTIPAVGSLRATCRQQWATCWPSFTGHLPATS